MLPLMKDYEKYPLTTSHTAAESTKLQFLLQQLQLYPNEKCIVFSQFNPVIAHCVEAFTKMNIKFVEFHQAISAQKRSAVLTKFETDDSIRVIIMKTELAAYGLNIVHANRIFIMDPVMDYNIERQAIARAHRIGQTKEVYVVKLIARDTIEDEILKEQSTLDKNQELRKIHSLLKTMKLIS